MTELLRWQDLNLTYRTNDGDVPAVRGVDLHVDSGEVLGIAGESGCGKSSLASTALRLQPTSAKVDGQIIFREQDLLTMKWGKVRAVRWAGASMVFQGALHSLNPVRRVSTQIAEPLRIHSPSMGRAELDSRVNELLEQVRLPTSRASAYPHQLSGGQRQRVMIAMALACRPELIVADEPTTALDVMVQAQILDLLTGLVRDLGVGMVLISHDLSVLSDVCDRIAVMYAGRVIEVGPAASIFTDPQHPYTAALSAAFPRIGDPAARFAPSGLPGDPPDLRDLPAGCSFAPRCDRADELCHSTSPRLAASDDRLTACHHPGAR